ncbi:MAG: hypothetical protein ABEJ94_11285 [Halorientalis sp.]
MVSRETRVIAAFLSLAAVVAIASLLLNVSALPYGSVLVYLVLC